MTENQIANGGWHFKRIRTDETAFILPFLFRHLRELAELKNEQAKNSASSEYNPSKMKINWLRMLFLLFLIFQKSRKECIKYSTICGISAVQHIESNKPLCFWIFDNFFDKVHDSIVFMDQDCAL